MREGVSSVFWEEALWNHLLFLLLTNLFGNQDWLPSALLGFPPPQDLLLRAHRSQFLVGNHWDRESVTRECSYPGAVVWGGGHSVLTSSGSPTQPWIPLILPHLTE